MKKLQIVGLALFLALLGGCRPTEKAQVREGARNLGEQAQTAVESARQVAADAALVAKVKTALGTRKGLKAGDIDVDAKGGVVTLKGDVDAQAQADLAEQVAEGTEGVRSVVNQLMLRVPARGSTTAARPATAGTGR
jgi:osmotically-inducible protein OsmY